MIARARRQRDARLAGSPADDRGAVLVLVLLLIVVAGLLVIPLMTYATSVLQLNTAVSQRSQDVEAAKGGLRMALNDATASDVFVTCDTDGGGSGNLGIVTINDTTVTTICAELEEVGPLDALGFEVPVGAVATQLGATTPANAIGGTAQSPAVPPYPDDSLCSGSAWSGCWWASQLPLPPDELWAAVDGDIWMPELPRLPSTIRTDDEPAPYYSHSAAFDTATGVECRVFFPGRYEEPLTLDGNSYYYFASGVYYFTRPITITGDADVVVGMGIEDFEARPEPERSYCADDLQIAAEFTDPIQKAIDGGGATWVFGDQARLLVDDSTGSPSIRFNQRYSEQDRGGRISIMTVNGIDAGAAVLPHDVPDVNYVRPSQELEYDDLNDVFDLNPIVPSQYRPSVPLYTDAARLPSAPTLTVIGHKHRRLSDGTDRGAVLAVWDELVDNAAGGALIDEFEVQLRRTSGSGAPTAWTTVCTDPGDIVHLSGTGSGGVDQHACYVAEQRLGRDYEVRVRARNVVGWGPRSTAGDRTPGSGGNDAVPDAPTGVTVEETDVDGVARIGWTPSVSPDVPINGYTATLSKIVGAAEHPELPPRMFYPEAAYLELIGYSPIGYRIATVDPNGEDPTSLSLDLSGVPDGWDVEATSQIDLLITPPPTGAPTPFDPGVFFPVDYTVTDQDGISRTKNLTIGWVGNYSGDPADPNDGPSPYPDAKTFEAYVSSSPSSPSVFELPFTHARGEAASVTADTIASLPPGWNATRTGNALTVWTSLTDGSTALMTFTVTDTNDGDSDTATITLIAPTGTTTLQPVDMCTVVADPWFPVAQQCEIADVDDLVSGESGFVASVVANSVIGDSAPSADSPTRGSNFEGGGPASPAQPERVVDPWTPEAIVDVRNADPANAVHVHIAGYVAVPMGRIRVDNPEADENDTVEIVGGVLSGTYDLNDDDDDTLIGFFNDIVLQRRIRIVSTADGVTSTAVVQINEDASYRINSWVVN